MVAVVSNLVKLQQKLLDVMGPLFKVWTAVEKVSNSRFEQVEVSLTNLDQIVMLLDQACNNISCTIQGVLMPWKKLPEIPGKQSNTLKKNKIFVKEKQFIFDERF